MERRNRNREDTQLLSSIISMVNWKEAYGFLLFILSYKIEIKYCNLNNYFLIH